jgi:CRP/FNR family transcriptional regulator, cyclic AMP receptor protein
MVPGGSDVQPCAYLPSGLCTETMTTTAPMNSTAAALSDHPFLSSIPTGSLRRLATHVQHHTYPAGEQVFREGQIANRFFLIRHGLVRLDLEVAGRGQVCMETLGSDAALGWSWLFSPYRWQLTATAVERTSMLVFDTDALQVVMAADPPLGYELMRRFSAVMFDRLVATRLQLTGDAEIPSAGTTGPWAGKRTTAPHWH